MSLLYENFDAQFGFLIRLQFFQNGFCFQNDAKSCANSKLMHLIKYSAIGIIKFQSFSKARLCATNFLLERFCFLFSITSLPVWCCNASFIAKY